MRFDLLERSRIPLAENQRDQVCWDTMRRLRRVLPSAKKRVIVEKDLLVIEIPVVDGKKTPVVVQYEFLEDVPLL